MHGVEGASAACGRVAVGHKQNQKLLWALQTPVGHSGTAGLVGPPQTQETEVNGAPDCGPSGAERNPGRGGLCPHHLGFRAASRPQEAFSVHRYRIHSSVQLPGRACGHRGEPQGWSTDGHCHSLAFWPFILGPQATTPLLSQGDRWDPVATSRWQAVTALCC